MYFGFFFASQLCQEFLCVKTFFGSLGFFFTKSVWAVPEQILAAELKTTIESFRVEKIESNEFQGVDNVKIHYLAYRTKNPRGVIALSPGQSEAAIKYIELVYDLRDAGYDIFIIDHRGQGLSGRLLPDSVKSHVLRFDDYVEDFAQFVHKVVQPHRYAKSFLLAHSMGGTIAAEFLFRVPKIFSAVILTAPMLEIDTKGLGYTIAGPIAAVLSAIGRDDKYAPGQKPFDAKAPFVKNTLTSSEARFNLFRDMRIEHPELAVGGATVLWLKNALKFTLELREKNNVFQVPTLLLQAEKDSWVKPGGQNEICKKRSPKFCKVQIVKGSRHEILMERDAIRDQVLKTIDAFIAEVD